MGCTEPGAVALAAAYASEVFTGSPEKIEVTVNPNIYKNGVAVGIPGTGETGLIIAAALGTVKKHSEKELSVLEGVSADELQQARSMMKQNRIDVQVDMKKESLWVAVKLSGGGEITEAIIQDTHTNLVELRRNGVSVLGQKNSQTQVKENYRSQVFTKNVRVADLIKAIEEMPLEKLDFIQDGIDMNLAAAKIGIEKKLGMGIGAALTDLIEQKILPDDIVSYAKRLTAGASDARMSGENVKVMSSAGSGNHGLTVILPVYAVAERLKFSREQLIRAVAISHLITVYVKTFTGHLSALCGCAVAAATGATAAIAWLIDGQVSTIEAAMKNVIGNLSGMICDGGKVGCALKLSTAAAAAIESAFLAQKNVVVPETNGIVGNTIENTVANLGQVSNPGMVETDHVILNVMLAK